jgi:acyl-CoA thioesterase-2
VQETDLEDVPDPEGLEVDDWGAPGDVRIVSRRTGAAESRMWMRTREALPDDPVLHDCALTYLSDHNAVFAVERSHPQIDEWDESAMSASLDHSVWFHRPARADEWLLYSVQGHGLADARGLATGTIHDRAGRHVATIAQEALVRTPRARRG